VGINYSDGLCGDKVFVRADEGNRVPTQILIAKPANNIFGTSSAKLIKPTVRVNCWANFVFVFMKQILLL